MTTIILASSSKARKALMDRLFFAYTCIPADLDEIPIEGETHPAFVLRMSEEKAKTVAEKHPQAICIGSDAIASLKGQILGKPMNHKAAVEQLQKMSGQTVQFLTGVCVYQHQSGRILSDLVVTNVTFREFSSELIEYYLNKAKPYESAGSLHSEGLGIILMKRWEGEDPTALMGLPLIRLTQFLEAFNVSYQTPDLEKA